MVDVAGSSFRGVREGWVRDSTQILNMVSAYCMELCVKCKIAEGEVKI